MNRQFATMWVAGAALLGQCIAAADATSNEAAPSFPAWIREALADELSSLNDVVFCTRTRYDDGHWYANIGYYCEDENQKAYPGNGRPDDSKLFKLNLRTGRLQVLLDAAGGTIRDPQVHYDGRKILFAWRRAGEDPFHLHEINVDGSGLRQLTTGAYDDYEPTYLPNGDILFVSTRCQRWVNCWKTQVGIMYRCDAEGRNIRPVSANTEHDNTPWVMPDGRILYTRWEYVDRSQVEFHHLWTMNPDGTGQMVYYGNMRPHIVMIDAKPIPGSHEVLANFSPGHGVNEHAGIATLVSPDRGPDDPGSARALHPRPLVRDPMPLSQNHFLATRGRQIVWMNRDGQSAVIHDHGGEAGLHEVRPIRTRPREKIIVDRTNTDQETGLMVLADVYHSRNLPGVEPGEIKKLLILESLPKPVNFSGGPDLVSWLGTFTLERVLGTVPVEADGSACFEVPANRQIFFVALDDDDLSVKRMQSFTCVMPGETMSCVGCHENRNQTARSATRSTLKAMRRPPSRIQPYEKYPDVLDFTRDVQPILDRHCVSCHGYERREAGLILSGDLGAQWSHAYFSLLAHKLVADGRNGLGNQPPRTIGSSASRLLKLVDGSHYEARATPEEWRTLWLWIESGAPYAGSYAALRNEADQAVAGRAMGTLLHQAGPVLRRRCGDCHEVMNAEAEGRRPLPYSWDYKKRRRQFTSVPTGAYERCIGDNDPIVRYSPAILVNFTRPEKSVLLLGPLAKDAGGFGSCGKVFEDTADRDYQALLRALRSGQAIINASPRYSMAGFKPNSQYVREMKRFGVLPVSFDHVKEALDIFATDRAYWCTLWHRGNPAFSSANE